MVNVLSSLEIWNGMMSGTGGKSRARSITCEIGWLSSEENMIPGSFNHVRNTRKP